jgi:Domain of unknown function (DUF5666)
MNIPHWRVALTGSALIVLSAVGFGLVQASSPVTSPANVAAMPATPATQAASAAGAADDLAAFTTDARLRAGRHLVHGTVTIDSPKEGLITVQLDGGSISAVDADSMTIAEKGGGSITVTLNTDTRVRVDGKRGRLTDLKVGQVVRVVSRVGADGAATARRVVVPPTAG